MTLFQIALTNLRRRKKKALLALLAITLGATALVAVFSLVREMENEITRQLADLGANVVITADTGLLSFSYGGIIIPEVYYDIEELTMADLELLHTLPDWPAVLAVSPKLVGIAAVNGTDLAVVGGSLEAEYAVKPWLRLSVEEEEGAKHEKENPAGNSPVGMRRPDQEAPALGSREVVVGKIAAERLDIKEDELIDIAGTEFQVVGIMHPTGGSEDNQVFMNYEAAEKLLNMAGSLTVIELAVDFTRVTEERMLGQLETALPHARATSVRQAVLGRNELIGTISSYGFSAALLIFFSGVFLVGLNIYTAVRERTREIGIFRAIGFRGAHIMRIICTEGLLLSAFGGVIGYHGGLLAAYQVWPLFSGQDAALAWDPLLLASTVLVTAVTGVLAAILPARLAAAIDPAEALRFF